MEVNTNLYLEPVWIRPDDVDRIGRLSGRLGKTYSEIVSAALELYEDGLDAVDEAKKRPTRMSFEVIVNE